MRIILLALITFMPLPCLAAYTGNHNSTVSWLKIYNSDTIYFKLSSMPTDHQCSSNFFILSPNLTEKQRDRYYSMLMTARVSGKTVSVGYDKNNPACVSNRPIVYALSL